MKYKIDNSEDSRSNVNNNNIDSEEENYSTLDLNALPASCYAIEFTSKSLGMELAQRKKGGIVVKHVVEGYQAFAEGIRRGMRIINVDSQDISNKNLDVCMSILQNAPRPVTIVFKDGIFFERKRVANNETYDNENDTTSAKYTSLLYKNIYSDSTMSNNNWVKFRLEGGKYDIDNDGWSNLANKSAIGARIILHSNIGNQMREIIASKGHGSMNPLVQHFGLKDEVTFEGFTIKWPSKDSTSNQQKITYYDGPFQANKIYTIVEHLGIVGIKGDTNDDQFVDVLDVVRTIKFGESYELCGGTHVDNTKEIEDFKIISEGSQAFGIRRITASSNKTRIKEEHLKDQALKEKAESEKANKLLQKEIDSQNKLKIQSIKELIINEIKEVNGLNTFTGELELDNKSIKELCFSLSNEIDNLFMIVLSSSDEKVFISCFISKNLIAERNFNASNIIKQLAPIIDGSGGGQPFFATGGGKNINAIDKALAESEKIITQL